MKKIIYSIATLASLTLTACGDADELPPRVETYNDKAITLPTPPRLNDTERDILSRQRQEWADFVAGGGVQEPATTQETEI